MSSSLDDLAAAERVIDLLQSLSKASGFVDLATSKVVAACEATKEMFAPPGSGFGSRVIWLVTPLLQELRRYTDTDDLLRWCRPIAIR